MKKPVPVIITGMGGPLGISFLKALRISDIPCKIIGTDVEPLAVGLFMVDVVYILPDARREPKLYIEKIIEVCRENEVKIVFAGSEAELRLLSRYKGLVEKETGSFLMVNNSEVVETACDKWKLVQFFNSRGIPVPDSVLPDETGKIEQFIEQHDFPLVVKPRFSSGSKGLFVVKNEQELYAALVLSNDAIIQEYLEPPDQEYTVGVFMQEFNRYLGSIIFKRWLGGGLTYKAIVTMNSEIEAVARDSVMALGAVGPINVQLRLTEKGPVIFEVNPRMSSSTIMRAKFGFNEPEMAIRNFVFRENISPPKVKKGVVLRYWEELYV